MMVNMMVTVAMVMAMMMMMILTIVVTMFRMAMILLMMFDQQAVWATQLLHVVLLTGYVLYGQWKPHL